MGESWGQAGHLQHFGLQISDHTAFLECAEVPYAAEEGLDAAELARGFLAEVLGGDVTRKNAWFQVTRVPLLGCTDAKDCFDRLTQDTGFGTHVRRA